jgi:hypothetical protein
MIIRLLGVAIMVSQLSSAAYATNTKLLDREADTYSSKIWSGISISESQLKQNFSFLYNPEQVDKKYGNKSFFNEELQSVKNTLKDDKFNNFCQTCMEVFKKGDKGTQIGIHMLFEKVAEKYSLELKRLGILRNRNKENTDNNPHSPNNILNVFSNADKGINVH